MSANMKESIRNDLREKLKMSELNSSVMVEEQNQQKVRGLAKSLGIKVVGVTK